MVAQDETFALNQIRFNVLISFIDDLDYELDAKNNEVAQILGQNLKFPTAFQVQTNYFMVE